LTYLITNYMHDLTMELLLTFHTSVLKENMLRQMNMMH